MVKHFRDVGIPFAAVLLMASCSAPDSEATDALSGEEVAARYSYDIAEAEYSPVFELIPNFLGSDALRAGHLLMRDCLAGIAEYHVPDAGLSSALEGRDGQPIFNEAIAAEWGYPVLRLPQEQWPGISNMDSLSSDDLAEYEKCATIRGQKLKEPRVGLLFEFVDAGWDFLDNDEEFAEVQSLWRECMAPQGLVDLPESPTDMPPDSMWGNPDESGNYTDVQLELTEKERAIAIADARCRADVKYYETVRRLRAEGELVAIGKNIESFEASRVAYETFKRDVEAVLAEHS